jgi:DNA repair protein RadC
MPLKDLPAALRPREKLLSHGPTALADAELLALLLRTGLPGLGVLQFAERLLDEFDGLPGLLRAGADELRRFKGLGPAKRAELVAVLEIVRRSLGQQLREQPVFDSPLRVKDFLRLHLGQLGHEVFGVLYLDAQHRMLKFEELFRGTLAQALACHAAAVILAHNHPSGVAEPSRADEYLTTTLKSALQLVDVRVLDHLIVGQGDVVSFAERGLL